MSQAPRELRSKWPLALCVLASFVVGFGVSFVSRRKVTPPNESKIQISDFRVAIPEGETVVTILSRDPEGEDLGQLTIQRRGNTILGVPAIEKRIEPRAHLTAEDAAYLRRSAMRFRLPIHPGNASTRSGSGSPNVVIASACRASRRASRAKLTTR